MKSPEGEEGASPPLNRTPSNLHPEMARGHRLATFTDAAARRPYPSLNDQHEQQLSPAYLRTFDHERAALVQLCVHLEQKLLFLEKLQVQNVAGFGLSPRIDMQREIFA